MFLYRLFRVPFQPTGTNIVTNTAPTPGVRMRVVRRNGETATMVGLGEDLQLRIEIDQVRHFRMSLSCKIFRGAFLISLGLNQPLLFLNYKNGFSFLLYMLKLL